MPYLFWCLHSSVLPICYSLKNRLTVNWFRNSNWIKKTFENEYTRFAQQYDELKLTVSNDSLADLLVQEQVKTQRLLEELRTVKSSNATEIRRLKKNWQH